MEQQQQQYLAFDELQMFSCGLQHLEVASLCAARHISGLRGLHGLTCLSLRDCPNLTTNGVMHALQQLPQVCTMDGGTLLQHCGTCGTLSSCDQA